MFQLNHRWKRLTKRLLNRIINIESAVFCLPQPQTARFTKEKEAKRRCKNKKAKEDTQTNVNQEASLGLMLSQNKQRQGKNALNLRQTMTKANLKKDRFLKGCMVLHHRERTPFCMRPFHFCPLSVNSKSAKRYAVQRIGEMTPFVSKPHRAIPLLSL